MRMAAEYKPLAIPYWYFGSSVLLFLLQAAFGLVVGAQYLWPDLFFSWMPFNVARSVHINLLIFWLLIGFMGISYYIIVDEAGRELYSPGLARFQLGLLMAVGVGAIISYFFHYYGGQGMEYIEAAPVFDWLIVLAALIFLFNGFMTVRRSERGFNPITGLLIAMAVALSLLYIAGMPFLSNLSTQQFYWWWVIHYWVEGTWEVLEVTIIGYLLIKLTGVERGRIYRWLYLEAALVLFTAILGQGHHYFWIGTPSYWLGLGSIFSALEAVPPLLMLIDALLYTRRTRGTIENRMALHWLLGGGVMSFLGLSVWGGMQTWFSVNFWTHGTQITPSHGHLAFFGAFAMTEIAFIYYALARRVGLERFRPHQARGLWAFWAMTSGMMTMVLGLLVAGLVQVYISRVLGEGYITAQVYMAPWYALRWTGGWIFAIGVAAYAWDFASLGLPAPARVKEAAAPAGGSG